MIQRGRKYIEQGVTVEMLRGALREFQLVRKRLDALWSYYEGDHPIMQRKRTAQTANNKIVVNHASYISDMASSYLIGTPVLYSTDEAQKTALDKVTEAYKACDVDSVDAELAQQASIYGRGVEVVYANADAEPSTATLDPRMAFVVYDDTVEHRPLFGVYIAFKTDEAGRVNEVQVDTYTADKKQRFVGNSAQTEEKAAPNVDTLSAIREVDLPPKEAQNLFGDVQVVEYWNNDIETGDYEKVLTLIDAYNLLQSDRVNDKEQLVDAVLLILGEFLGDSEAEFQQAVKRLSEHRILEMGAGADARFLTKTLNEGEVQVLADALEKDIHKISMVPALTDEDFAGNSSGVAMRFKLMGFDQLTKKKERWFREGLRTRMRLFSHFIAEGGTAALDVGKVTMMFTRGLPVNELELAQTAQAMKDAGVPQARIFEYLEPIAGDPEENLKLWKQQQKDEDAREAEVQRKMFGDYPDKNKDEPINGDDSDDEDGADEEE